MIVLASESKIKQDAIRNFFGSLKMLTISTSNADLPNQPVNSALECSKIRIDYIKNNYQLPEDYLYIISIENGLVVKSGQVQDVCYVTVEDVYGSQYYGWSDPIEVPRQFYDRAYKLSEDHRLGISVTAGEIIATEYSVAKDDWMHVFKDGPNSREEQIHQALLSTGIF